MSGRKRALCQTNRVASNHHNTHPHHTMSINTNLVCLAEELIAFDDHRPGALSRSEGAASALPLILV